MPYSATIVLYKNLEKIYNIYYNIDNPDINFHLIMSKIGAVIKY
jgi:hypothetical protein